MQVVEKATRKQLEATRQQFETTLFRALLIPGGAILLALFEAF